MKLIYPLIIFLSCNIFVSFAQTGIQGNYFIRNYDPKEARSAAQYWSMTQDSRGVFYFAAGNKILQFNGLIWKSISTRNESSPLSLITGEDKQVYVGCNNEFGYLTPDQYGNLNYKSLSTKLKSCNTGNIWSICQHNNWTYFAGTEDLVAYHEGKIQSLKVKPNVVVIPSPEGPVVNIGGKGLCRLQGSSIVPLINASYFAKDNIVSGCQLNENEMLLVSGNAGILLYNLKTGSINARPHPILMYNSEFISNYIYSVHISTQGKICVGTVYNGLYIFTPSGQFERIINSNAGLANNAINKQYSDRYGNLWVCTDKGASRIEVNNGFQFWNAKDGIEGSVEDVIRYNGELLIASGIGLLRYENGKFIKDERLKSEVWQFCKTKSNRLMLSTTLGLLEYAGGLITPIIPNIGTFHAEEIEPDILLIGAEKGAYSYNLKTKEQIKLCSTASEIRTLGKDKHGVIWFATENNGVGYIKSGKTHMLSKKNGIQDSKFNAIFIYNKEAYIYTKHGLYQYNFKSSKIESTARFGKFLTKPELGIFRMKGDEQGNVWTSTYGDNTNRLSFNKYSAGSFKRDTLFFKRLPSLHTQCFYTDGNSVYFGTQEGLFQFNRSSIKSTDRSYSASINQITIGRDSILFHGTFRKPIKGGFELSNLQPKTATLSHTYDLNAFSFEYGSNYTTESEQLIYRVKLNGFDEQWSEWTSETKKSYTNLNEGTYTFNVQAKNIFGELSTTCSYTFTILPPWYRTWWAYTLYIILASVLVYGIVYLNTRRLKAANIRLEGIVTERTAEVVKQKEEIEEKNVQIMESIEYAKTIQEAILTSDEFFERVFPEHFVLFKPKDIVSGDFYWAYQTKSEKTFWVAADCTGHGVPGAFMTMIGNSLLNEIIIENGIEEVGTILDRLRDRIIQTLNKDVDLDSDEKMRNGMDISLCCWDKTTNKLFFSGANNPVFIIRNGELIELKGDKQPIGIHKRMTPFTCQEFDLLPGDQIYNFSDGYADQMGGEDEQRFKIANLKKAIVELSTLSLTEQGKKLDDIYVNWKGDVEQMDDVVLIGVKV